MEMGINLGKYCIRYKGFESDGVFLSLMVQTFTLSNNPAFPNTYCCTKYGCMGNMVLLLCSFGMLIFLYLPC